MVLGENGSIWMSVGMILGEKRMGMVLSENWSNWVSVGTILGVVYNRKSESPWTILKN